MRIFSIWMMASKYVQIKVVNLLRWKTFSTSSWVLYGSSPLAQGEFLKTISGTPPRGSEYHFSHLGPG